MSTLDLMKSRPRAATPHPLYAQVRDMLLGRIRAGEWSAGESLPNEHVLAAGFGVSVGTIRRAVAELEANGVLMRKQGRGTYVSGHGMHALAERFCALRKSDGSRLVYRLELLSLQLRPAGDAAAARLGMGPHEGVFEIVQRLAAGQQLAGIETSIVPATLVPRLETQFRFGQSIYPLLSDYGHLVTRVEDLIGVEVADSDFAGSLGCEIGTVLQCVGRLAWSLDGRTVEWRVGRYVPAVTRYAAATCAAPALV